LACESNSVAERPLYIPMEVPPICTARTKAHTDTMGASFSSGSGQH
jgi:hypothetical protein